MKDTLENKKKLREFRGFVALWLKTGYEWLQQKPELMEGWRFEHDWNNDYSYKNSFDDDKKYEPGCRFGKIPKEIRDSIQSTVSALVLSKHLNEEKLQVVCDWLVYNLTITRPQQIHKNDKFLGQMCYSLCYQLEQLEKTLEK